MIPVESNIAHPKRMFFPNNQGNKIKKESDGRTSQKISVLSCLILTISLVSKYSQMIAKKETKGTEASSPANNPLFLDISEISTIRTLEIRTLIM